MADFEQYKKSVSFTPSSTYEGNAGWAQYAQSMGNTIDYIHNKLINYETQRANKMGEIAGNDPSFKPIAGFGSVNEAYNRAGEEANKQMYNRNISQTLKQYQLQASQNPDAVEGMKSFNAMTREYGNVQLANAPESSKAYIKNNLQYYGTNGQFELQKNIINQNKRISQAEYESTAMQKTIDINNAINNGQYGPAQSLLQQKAKLTNLALVGGNISAKEHSLTLQKDIQNFNNNIQLSKYRNASSQGKGQQFIDNFVKNIPNGISTTDSHTLANKMYAEEHKKIAAIGTNKGIATNKWINNVTAIKNGAEPNDRVLELKNNITPGNDDAHEAEVNDAQIVYNVSKTAMTLPLDQQKAFIDKQLMPKKGDPDYDRKMHIYQDTTLNWANKAEIIIKDPISYYSKDPIIKSYLEQKKIEDNTGTNKPGPSNVNVRQLQTDIDDVYVQHQLMMGYPQHQINVLSMTEAQGILSQLSNTDTSGKINILNELKAQHGKYYRIALKDVMSQPGAKSVIGDTVSFLGDLNPSDPRMKIISDAMTSNQESLKSMVNDDDKMEIDNKLDMPSMGFWSKLKKRSEFVHPQLELYRDSFRNGGTENISDFYSRSNNMLRKLSYSFVANQGLSPDSAVKEATDVIAGNYNFINKSNQILRIPKTIGDTPINPNAVINYAKKTEKLLPKFDIDFSRYTDVPNSTSVKQLIYKNKIETGKWITNENSTGLMWVDVDGNPILSKNGHRFNIDFVDAVSKYAPNYGSFDYYSNKLNQSVVGGIKELGENFSGNLSAENIAKNYLNKKNRKDK